MARRNRVAFLLAIPLAAFLWSIGWSLSFGGTKKGSKRTQTKLAVPNELVMFVPTPENKYVT